VYEKNKALLKDFNADIYNKIQGTLIDADKYQIISSKTGHSTLQVNVRGKAIYLHSKYNPVKEAEVYIDEHYDVNISEYIVIGFGFAYHIQSLLEKNQNIKLHIFENNLYVLKAAMENMDLESILTNHNVKVILETDPQSYMSKLEEVCNASGRKLLIYLPALQAMDESFTEVRYLLEEYRINKRLIKSRGELEQNFIENIKSYNKSIDGLFNHFEGIPVVIVSAGPSLDKNIKLLKQVKSKGIIIAVGTAVKPLVKAGVQPDFIIVTDPSELIYKNQLESIDTDVPIIVLSTCDRNVMKHYKGYKYIAFQEGFKLAEVYAAENKHRLVKTGGSVATTALDIAIRWGGNPIVFVGQDLALTGGKTHAQDAYSRENADNTANLRPVEDVFGNTVYTTKVLHMYLKWIENRIREENQIMFIDATEGGARIKGTEVMKLQNVINEYLNDSLVIPPIIL
jgi:hypothetical protein